MHAQIQRRKRFYEKDHGSWFVLCLTSLVVLNAAAPQQQAQSDSMKHDSMSQDGMSKDKMSHDMSEAKVLKGWVSDSECAAHGEKKCSNKEHVTQGAKLVLVTDGDNKIWTVANPESLAEHQGHHVQVKATTDGDKRTINVQEVKML